MKIKLTIYMLVLITFISTLLTFINYYHSKQILFNNIINLAKTTTLNSRNSILEFLVYIKDISYNISRDYMIEEYTKDFNDIIKSALEKKFLEMYFKLPVIQAIRITDLDGNIKVFVREGKILSSDKEYTNINISTKDFFQQAKKDNNSEIILSNFERGRLPDTDNFCPAMIRTVVPIKVNGEKRGFLIVNFWGIKIGQFIDNFEKDSGMAFLVEVNNETEERNGIFLFHIDKKYEFANQFGSSYYFQNIYGKSLFDKLKNDSGIFKIDDDILSFNSIYPYKDKSRKWVICSIFYSSYYLGILNVLKNNLVTILFVSIFLSFFVSVLFSFRFFKPLNEIKLALNAYGKGDFNYRVDETKMDAELKEIVRNIYEMVNSLQKYIIEIEERQKKIELLNRLSSIGLLSSGISHELNTPLNSIILLCDILLEEAKKGKVNTDDINNIKNEAKRCVSIIKNLKLLDPQNKIQTNEVISIKEVLERNIKYFNNIFKKLHVESDIKDGTILANRVLINQVFFNIFLNAIEASDEECRIFVRSFEKDGEVWIVIKDYGRGMDEDTINNIFVPFFTTKQPDKGMGLGLSLVYKIVSDHNGKIEVTSKKGEWTEFTLRFLKYENFDN
ncbi:sensor histidine kinase [Calditerrivibrio nitroreducens]|uniref:histidine kinase n=1 Tax=Calditerrivibrio nitroreducens (strain DSM 19672 / NBRC 101217 / Yu37-1) TaxID=768670 RepID=E4TJ26_CALNY|nr:HAMP domain-containing sensor histidine kinase [Calditerrivibrio nitroreducens]ADR19158.1 integral membrane sensor signal transduction histidine kinase [Calditerrivibrio nitroreducens DSM 19672]